MKVSEVPQDPKNFKGAEKMRKLMYAVDKDGNYTGVNSKGWDAENIATKNAWDDADEQLEETSKKVRSGEVSPIAYFMQKNLMDVSLLAKYMSKWQWQINRHLRPEKFRKLSSKILAEYAEIFNISTEELRDFGKTNA